MYCQSCRAENPDDAEFCRRCNQKLLVLSGGVAMGEDALSDLEEEFSFDEHLLERISVLEEALKRTTETVEHLLGVVRKQEELLALAEAGIETSRELLERKGLVDPDEWQGAWERHRDYRLLALDKRDRFLRIRDRIVAVHRHGEGTDRFHGLVEEAEQALTALDLETAVGSLEAAFEIDPENYELAHLLGETLFNAGEGDRSLRFFEALLRLRPRHYEGLVYAGVISHEGGDLERAERLLRRAVESHPDEFLPHFSLGAVHAAEGDLERAVLHLERAVSIDPVPQALYLLGRTLHEMGRSRRAIECLEDTIRRNPDFEEAYHQLGLAYLDRGWRKKALEVFRTAQRLNPRKLRYREVVRYLTGDGASPLPPVGESVAEAVGHGERALRDDRPTVAYRYFRQALEEEPDHPTILTYYALACLAAGRPQEIEGVVERVLERAPGEMLVSTAMAAWIEALRAQGRLREGNRIGRRLLEIGATSFARTIAYYEMAWNLAEMEEDLDEALDYARKAMDLAPEELSQFPLAVMGWVHYKRKEYSEAVDYLSRSLKQAPSTSTLTQLGMALLAAGEEDDARRILDEARDLRGGGEGVEFKMMECLRESSRLHSRLHDRAKPGLSRGE